MLKKLFILCFLLNLFLRFYQFGQIPPGLNRDETSLGYTAYSLLKTGQDEYGYRFPLTIKSFGDWKLPAYVYGLIPFIRLFGLKDWVVRLPSALAGLGTIFILYLLSKKVFNQKDCSLFASLLLAITPWHLYFSRVSYEANLALFFLTLAIYFFLNFQLIFSSIFLTLTLYTYHSYHVFTPLFVFFLVILFRHKIAKQKKSFFLATLIFLIFGAFIFIQNLTGNLTKASGISFFTDPVLIHTQIEIPRSKFHPLLGRLIYNKPVVFSKIFLANYLSSFLPKFLVFEGGTHPVHNAPGTGNILLVQYLLFLIGFWQLLKKTKEKSYFLLLIWLILSPLASSITKDAPSSVRLTPMIIPLTLISGLGIKALWEKTKTNQNLQRLMLTILVIGLTINLLFFVRNYFFRLPVERSQNWGAGYQELVAYLDQPENQNRTVIMTRPHYSPYIYFLFYQQYDPRLYQQEANRYSPTPDGFEHVKSFSRYQFADFEPKKEIEKGRIVVLWAEMVNQEDLKLLAPFLQKMIAARDRPLFYVFQRDHRFAIIKP